MTVGNLKYIGCIYSFGIIGSKEGHRFCLRELDGSRIGHILGCCSLDIRWWYIDLMSKWREGSRRCIDCFGRCNRVGLVCIGFVGSSSIHYSIHYIFHWYIPNNAHLWGDIAHHIPKTNLFYKQDILYLQLSCIPKLQEQDYLNKRYNRYHWNMYNQVSYTLRYSIGILKIDIVCKCCFGS